MGIKYVKMQGAIAVISNGSGSGMATMDHLVSIGGSVSSCSDIGKTYHEQIETLMDITAQDDETKVVFVNFFAGGLDKIVYIGAVLNRVIKSDSMRGKPMVIRIKGISTHPAYAEQMKAFNLKTDEVRKIYFEEDFDIACQLAVSLS